MLAAADPEEGNAPEVDEEKTNKRAPRPNNFFEIGVRGRKTGVKAPENVRLDENGMEMIEDWFKEEEPEGMDDLTVHEPADSGSIGTPKAAVSKAVPSPAPVSITPATDRAQNSATPEPARNAIYRLPRPSMIPPALSPTDEDSPHSSANTSHQFSMISNSSIVEEDIPSPRAILSPVRPFHLPTSGSMSSNANVSSSTSSKKSPATARETMRVPGRTVVQHSPPQRRVKEVVHSAQKPAQNSGRPPHPLMEMTTADTQDECFDAQENAESFGGAEETFGGEEVEAEEEALEEGPSASADYSADNLDVSMEPADIEADLEEEEQQAYDDMVENNQESVPSSPSRKRNEGNRKRKVISNDSDSDASNNDTTIRKKQQQQNGRSEAKVAAIPRRPQPSAKKLRLSDDRDRSRRGAEESEGEEAEQTPPAPTATLKKQSQSESARNSNKSSPLMSKRAEPKRQTRDKRVVRDPSTSNEEPANPHPEDDDVEEPETHGEPVASNRKAKQARPEAPSSKKTAATRTRKISEAVQHADHDDDDADDHDDNDEVEELETHREPVASTRKAKKQSRPEPTSSKTTAAKHGRKISEELQPADDESDDDDEQSFSQPLLGSGRNGADKGFRNGSGKNNERSARRNGWNDSDAHDDASANESTMEPEPQPEFDDMEQQDDHEDDVNGDVGHSADNASESDAGMQATSPVRSKPTATRKTVPSRSKALAAKQSGTSKTVAQKGKGMYHAARGRVI
ncbi:uncharacterized protein EV422DRAFT_81468 [Fimicolochytrium jonesii]|uniref:uncharacterized protein n=1 Tax=Fimicolochytrium jonesii TaxID=1396493 RepID=UPI0022FE2A1C|nr:uncharacterized protein EV422DRAFT_81468 [Fimicolochytrium jonesii]KAI8820169.1 hypothetical protein EV422DRAFT_81468 [Fimicolochytrium jonesii]